MPPTCPAHVSGACQAAQRSLQRAGRRGQPEGRPGRGTDPRSFCCRVLTSNFEVRIMELMTAASSSQFRVARNASGSLRVTFNNPPINLVDPDTILQLHRLMDQIEADQDL